MKLRLLIRRGAAAEAKGRPCAAACTALLCGVLGLASASSAWVVPHGAPPDPACPPIPDADDISLSDEEIARVAGGEIVVRMLERGDNGGRVQAVGYLEANPAWLFEVATDSELAPELADVLERVDVLETRAAGKTMRGVADPSRFLPKYEYTLAVSYLHDGTGQCWAQIEGDFGKNEGSHSYLWDPERQATLSVFTFELRLKGWLRIVPQGLVMRLTARTLPSYMRALESFSARLEREDPARAAAVEAKWSALRQRLESDDLDGRVWRADRARVASERTPATDAVAASSDAAAY